MARQRTLKPEFFRDKVMARLGPVVALVYESLWCWADDGNPAAVRIEPDLLKGEAFARWHDITNDVLTEALVSLQKAGRIKPYRVGDELYALVHTLWKHSPVNRPSKFRLPRGGEEVTDIKAWLKEQHPHGGLMEGSLPVSVSVSLKDKDTTGADAPPESLGAWYGKRLKPFLGKDRGRKNENRDISVLKDQFRNTPRGEVEIAVAEMRRAADAGELPGFIGPGEGFGLMALCAEANGGIAVFQRFLAQGMKRVESKAERGGRPTALADLLKGGT